MSFKEENKNIKDTLLYLQRYLESSKCSENLSNGCIMMEYKYLQKFSPPGVYILPQLDNNKIWHGSIFIREGPYRGGIFKFEIQFPNNYPSKIPEVYFTNKVVHSYIQESTGKLDLSKNFQTWDSGKNYAIQVVYFIQNIFYDENCFFEENSYNPNIGLLAKTKFEDYLVLIESSIKENNELLYINKNKNNSMNFTKCDEDKVKKIKDKIINQDINININDRVEEFKTWFCNNFTEELINNKK